ncbi:MAG: phage major capsid protein [Deltaproteobacteria bacterium]|nr:phage major capsid protein [Deltaproteobacteria bacterium]
MKLHELLEKRTRLAEEGKAILAAPAGADGYLSAEQETRHQALTEEIGRLDSLVSAQAKQDDIDRRTQGSPVGEQREPQEPAELRAGQFLQSVAHQMTPGGRGLETRAYGMSEGIGSDGGFVVPPEQSNLLLQPILEANPVLNLCQRVPSQTGNIQFPYVDESSRVDGSRHGGTLAYRVPEGDQITKSLSAFKRLSVKADKLVVMVPATDELLDDAPALGTTIPTLARAELEFAAVNEVINGTGTGEMLGILNSPSLVSVAKEIGQDADTIVYENCLAMWARLWPRGRGKAVWLVGPGTETQLYQMTLGVGVAGQPVFMPAGGASATPYASLFGRPVITVEQLPALGEQGDIILADLSQFLVVERSGIQGQSSIHLRFDYAETLFRYIWRVGGQPIWSSAQTPYNGGATVSPFVVLDERG